MKTNKRRLKTTKRNKRNKSNYKKYGTKKIYRQRKRKYKKTNQSGGDDRVCCLIHGTSVESFKEMLETNSINPNPGDEPRVILGYTEILNKGTFFSLVLNCDTEGQQDISTLCSTDIILVFSKDILTTPYHISTNWCGGMQYSPLIPGKKSICSIRTYDDVVNYINDNSLTLCKGNHSKNEVVFNEPISLDNLIEIWICNVRTMTQRQNTRNPDGTYSRKNVSTHFNPDKIKEIVEILLSAKNKDIPVKIISFIPEIGPEHEESTQEEI